MGLKIVFTNMAIRVPVVCIFLLFVLVRTNGALPHNFAYAKKLEEETNRKDILIKDFLDPVNSNEDSVRNLFRRSKGSADGKPRLPVKGKTI